ncbi:MAG: putative bifunctional diguanylate cyclase/phosphodiesterase [Solirubrobacteraceae bacterium]
MTPRRPRFTIGFCWLVGAVGILALVLALQRHGGQGYGMRFAVLSLGVLLGELVPLKLPLRGGDEEANLSTPFAFAILISAGLAPAMVAQVGASLVQDLVARKPIWRCAFNVGQYVLCLAAAGVVLTAIGAPPGAPVRASIEHEVAATLLAGVAFYAANLLIVGTAVASYQGTPLRQYLRSDLATTTLMAGVSISLAPLVLAALDQSPLLIALFVLPFVAVHRSGRLACDSARQALHDALTGLPNRMRFQQLVDDAISEHDAGGRFAVMLLDLNRFKEINDTLGHHYGDLCLQETTARLRAVLDDDDPVARLGGDEFAILIRSDAPEAIAARLTAALQEPVHLDGFILEIDASIGIARFPEDGGDLETLLRRADVAMYTAKSRHLGHLFYSAEIDEYDPTRFALVADLRRAVESDELVLHYQPKLDVRSGTVTAVEALARWEHPRLGLLYPAAFIDLAEHTGLIRPLTHRVLEQAIRQCAEWHAGGLELQVAVNVSPRSLLDRTLPGAVAAALARSGLCAAQLKLEITETAIMVDPAAIGEVLDQLGTMGVALSIDDFGTGYSSLAHLRRLPVEEVKVDRSFVRNMVREDGDRAIVRAIVDLAANLGLAVVAEGVEDADTMHALAELGCDMVQGYYVSRPVPAAQLVQWLDRSARVATGTA